MRTRPRFGNRRLHGFGGSSPPIPLSIPGLAAWYDASKETAADATATASITDRSGNGRHALQATGALQPVFKTNIQNGLGIYRFDGVGTFSQSTFTLLTPATVLGVAKLRATNAGAQQFLCDSKAPAQGNADVGAASVVLLLGANLASPGSLDTTAFHRFSYQLNGATSDIRLDAIVTAGNTSATGVDLQGVTLGAAGNTNAPAAVDWAEYLIYNSALSSTQLTTLMTYLKNKWSVA